MSRAMRVRRIIEDAVFFIATAALAWWAMIDRSPAWLTAVCVGGALAVAVIARRLLVWVRQRQDRARQ